MSLVLGITRYKNWLIALTAKTPIIANLGVGLETVGEILKTGIYRSVTSREITKDFKSISIFDIMTNGLNNEEQTNKASNTTF